MGWKQVGDGWLHTSEPRPMSSACLNAVKTVTKAISKDGMELGPDDGFIVQGCIFASHVGSNGRPGGGLIGNGKLADCLDENGVPFEVYDKEAFLKALGFKPEELRKIADRMADTFACSCLPPHNGCNPVEVPNSPKNPPPEPGDGGRFWERQC